MNNPSIEIVAVSYFGSGALPDLVASAVAQSEKAWRMTVVDNSCDSHERAKLAEICTVDPRVRLLEAPRNLGYFGAALFSHQYLSSDAEWVIVSNADISLASDALSQLSVISSKDVGVVGPAIVSNASAANQNPYMPARPTRFSMWRRRLTFQSTTVARLVVLLASRRSRQSESRSPEPSPGAVYAVHGAWVAFSAEFFRRGGNFEHPPFLFGEELTVAERCRELGLPVVYAPSVRVEHAEHQATGSWRSTEVLRHQRFATKYALRLLFPRRRQS